MAISASRIKALLGLRKKSIDRLDLEPQQRSDLQDGIQTMEAQISFPKMKVKVITGRLGSIKRILEGATRSVLASGLLIKIIALSGDS